MVKLGLGFYLPWGVVAYILTLLLGESTTDPPGKDGSMMYDGGIVLLAFSYSLSGVPLKSCLMPKSFHVLVEKFFQFKHTGMFSPRHI